MLNGDGATRDGSRAFALNTEAAALGHHDAVLAMGWFFNHGVGVAKDDDESRRWYRQSARQGDPRAMFSLGSIAIAHREVEDALTWLRRAADAGHARSLFLLGTLYWRGNGVTSDRKEAMRLFQQASAAKVPEARRFLRLHARLHQPYRRGPK